MVCSLPAEASPTTRWIMGLVLLCRRVFRPEALMVCSLPAEAGPTTRWIMGVFSRG